MGVVIFLADQTTNALVDMTLGELLAIIGTLALVVGGIWKTAPLLRKLSILTDDWNGQDARPGIKARKGVMERLGDQDDAIEDIKNTQAKIQEDIAPIVEAAKAGVLPGASNQDIVDQINALTEQSRIGSQHSRKIERLLFRHMRESTAWIAAVNHQANKAGHNIPPWPNIPDPDDDEDE